ncbi:glycosyltransferase [Paracoccus aminophilus]|uniref:Rhamnosyl transferase n=1 Tax=Paracoccus aminophilus JCM 7686 TaxID=1367847 RepID=S5YFI6_PARAH|nr:glycosyltransferase [Paracoccus aminophilus]AGT10253.1 hypothetical protein JCM7686_3217 [Paracoccus aminophilus JCM 7686]
MRLQMLGLCRFSYAGLGGHQQRHETVADRKAVLYDPARLRRRWNWFETVALPGLVSQSDEDFTLVMMACPDLPEPYLSRLRELEAEIPAIRLSLIEPQERYLEACRAAIQPHIDPDAEVVGHFRHDDDDAIALDYIASAKRDFMGARAIWQRSRKLACDYALGVVGKVEPDGVRLTSRFIYLSTAALTVYLPAETPQTAIDFEHWRLATRMPVLTFGQKRMFLRLIHADNDSGEVGAGYGVDDTDTDFAELLGRRFGIDRAALDLVARESHEAG